MTVDFLEFNSDGSSGVLCTLGERAGAALFLGGDARAGESYLEMPVRDPDAPGRYLVPEDGERFLSALPFAYSGSRVRAKIRED